MPVVPALSFLARASESRRCHFGFSHFFYNCRARPGLSVMRCSTMTARWGFVLFAQVNEWLVLYYVRLPAFRVRARQVAAFHGGLVLFLVNEGASFLLFVVVRVCNMYRLGLPSSLEQRVVYIYAAQSRKATSNTPRAVQEEASSMANVGMCDINSRRLRFE